MRLHLSFIKEAGLPPCSHRAWIKMQLANDLPIIFPNLRVFQCIPRHQLESEQGNSSEYACLQAVFVPASEGMFSRESDVQAESSRLHMLPLPRCLTVPFDKGPAQKPGSNCALLPGGPPHQPCIPHPCGESPSHLTQDSASNLRTSNQGRPL